MKARGIRADIFAQASQTMSYWTAAIGSQCTMQHVAPLLWRDMSLCGNVGQKRKLHGRLWRVEQNETGFEASIRLLV